MVIVNETLLDQFRGPGRCEWCKLPVRNRHPHHIFTKGAGRLDLRFTIISLCETFSGGLNCHDEAHRGHIARYDLLALVAVRERVNQDDVEQLVYFFRGLPKRATERDYQRALGRYELTCGALGIIQETWEGRS